ncbi:reverse transcriptase domain-containing protein [Tanacetum coccineum]
MKNITKDNKDDYRWTEDAKRAFQEMKKLIRELPFLTTLIPKEILYVYLTASQDAVSGVLLGERKGKQTPIRYVHRTLHEAERNYAPLEKLALLKGQVLADLLNETPIGTKHMEICSLAGEEANLEEWTLYTDGVSNPKGVGVGLVLIDPNGVEYAYAIRLNFASTNNEAEYEALLAGLRIA